MDMVYGGVECVLYVELDLSSHTVRDVQHNV